MDSIDSLDSPGQISNFARKMIELTRTIRPTLVDYVAVCLIGSLSQICSKYFFPAESGSNNRYLLQRGAKVLKVLLGGVVNRKVTAVSTDTGNRIKRRFTLEIALTTAKRSMRCFAEPPL